MQTVKGIATSDITILKRKNPKTFFAIAKTCFRVLSYLYILLNYSLGRLKAVENVLSCPKELKNATERKEHKEGYPQSIVS